MLLLALRNGHLQILRVKTNLEDQLEGRRQLLLMTVSVKGKPLPFLSSSCSFWIHLNLK